MPITPRTVSGTLELLPRAQMVFQHMLETIRRGYEKYGFVQIETPVFEHRDVLLTKSGGETEKQVYFVQSTGALKEGHEADMALRFDLTVPLARYVAEHERELAFPFRRYQIQRVYRGERAQRGRFREFYQCDIDIIGKDKLNPLYDAELPAIITEIFTNLGLKNFTIHFSNRKILLGLISFYGVSDAESQKLALREIDKLDKIGPEKVAANLGSLGFTQPAAAQLLALITIPKTNAETLAALSETGCDNPQFNEGLAEVSQMVSALHALNVPEKHTKLNLAIARGLDYYTGTVYETLIDDHPEFGSVCSGGRYENLASHYTKSQLPGVGISIGLTRLYDQLGAHGLLPEAPPTVQIFIMRLDSGLDTEYLKLGRILREAGFTVETHLEDSKFDKQWKYADKSGIPVAILIGQEEAEKGLVKVKSLSQKTQAEISRQDLIPHLKTLFNQM